jgi:hypothetical protein
MLESLLPRRDLEQQLAGIVVVELGGHRYRVPTLSRRENRAWKEQLNDRLSAVLGGLSASDEPSVIFSALASADDAVVDLVRAYDASHVIPPDDELANDTDAEWLRALLAMAAAAYPFVGLALEAMRPNPSRTASPESMSSQPQNGAGSPTT